MYLPFSILFTCHWVSDQIGFPCMQGWLHCKGKVVKTLNWASDSYCKLICSTFRPFVFLIHHLPFRSIVVKSVFHSSTINIHLSLSSFPDYMIILMARIRSKINKYIWFLFLVPNNGIKTSWHFLKVSSVFCYANR